MFDGGGVGFGFGVGSACSGGVSNLQGSLRSGPYTWVPAAGRV